LKNQPKGRQGREFAGHMTGVIRKVNSKKPKDDWDSWGAVRGNWIEEPVEMS
jgi:hypothetical protein